MFKIDTQLDDKILVLSVQGYCESAAGKEIYEITKKAFTVQKLTGVIFDFSACKVINSSCIALLMETAELVTCDFRSDAVVCGLDQTKISFFKMFGMLDLAELKDDIESAKKYLAD
ncbi:MAG: hypothetical protein A2W80_02755 [Candidatus Riflebacteria bacterium GWC2_50_8]|nr:MAG: hypothetical protein A2W80_02755 [Candidatus Riflebacteria bacterium GWC2_50_8]